MWRGALFGSKCMEIKVSYVQARRFIDYHTLNLNSCTLFIMKLGKLLWISIWETEEKNDTKNACGRIVLCAVYRVWCGAEN